MKLRLRYVLVSRDAMGKGPDDAVAWATAVFFWLLGTGEGAELALIAVPPGPN